MNTAFAHLNTVNRLGAAQFAERRLATDHSAVTRTVRRHRVKVATTGTVASVGVASASLLGLSHMGVVDMNAFPGLGSPEPSLTAVPTTEEITVEAGITADDAIAVFAAGWGISDDDAREILTDEWNRTLRVEWGGPNLEGWIASGTYVTADYEAPQHMAADMIWTTVDRLQEAGIEEDDWLQALTIASLIEAESQSENDMPRVNVQIHDRLDQGQPLELDSTVRYAINAGSASLTEADRAVESPYNTYLNAGLPPGPIATVSYLAIHVTATIHFGVVSTGEVSPSPAPSPSPGADFVPEFALGCEVPRTGFTSGVANGYVPEGELCLLKDLQNLLRADAAVSLAHLNEQFKTELGKDICVLEGYRDANKQAEVERRRGVTAGFSAHGYGLAIDLCETSSGPDPIAWLEDNAPAWGWIQPESTAADEPWHWVYLPGAAEYPEDHGLSDREVSQTTD